MTSHETTGKRVLVTGGGGFLGRFVVRAHLSRGDHVISFARNQYDFLEKLQVEQVSGDIRDQQALSNACKDVDVVQHTAAVAGIWGPWDHYHSINTIGTENVINACQANGVRKLVFTSSPSVTFDGSDQCGVDESVGYPSRFLCHYPHTKALAEKRVLESNGSKELLTCALRPHLIWGPEDQHLIPRLLDRARSGSLRIVGKGDNLIDTIYVENAAEAQCLAESALEEDSPVAGNAYFLSQDEPVNCWDWINDILEIAKIPRLTSSIGFRPAWVAGGLMELIYFLTRRTSEPRMTRFLAAQLAKPHFFDISAAKRDFGYKPTISNEEGMVRLGEWIHRNQSTS